MKAKAKARVRVMDEWSTRAIPPHTELFRKPERFVAEALRFQSCKEIKRLLRLFFASANISHEGGFQRQAGLDFHDSVMG